MRQEAGEEKNERGEFVFVSSALTVETIPTPRNAYECRDRTAPEVMTCSISFVSFSETSSKPFQCFGNR